MKKQPHQLLFESIGWLGMMAILVSYILVSLAVIQPRSFAYQALSGLGSLGLVIHSTIKKDFQPLVLNIIWLLVAAFVLIQLLVDL